MSLKTVHIFFIVASTLMAAFVGVWALRYSLYAEGGSGYLALGIGALIASLALPIYGTWFLKKTKDVSYL